MTRDECIDVLGTWEGYGLGTVGRVEGEEAQNADEPEVWIELVPAPDYPHRCSGCGTSGLPIHDLNERWVRDLPILGMTTWLLIHRVRVACPDCGPKLEDLNWLSPYSRVTKRDVAFVHGGIFLSLCFARKKRSYPITRAKVTNDGLGRSICVRVSVSRRFMPTSGMMICLACPPAIPGERGRDLARGDNRSQQCWRFVSQ